MSAERIHLTLAFLGEVEQERLAELKALPVRGRCHELPIEQARYWPRSRIVWVGPERTPEPLLRLSGGLNRELGSRRFRTEAREFAAHITLLRDARAPEALPPLPRVRWPVEEVVLARSRLSPAGPDYSIVQRYALD